MSAVNLVAPLSGTAVALGQVPDPVFSTLMMGDGLAIAPTSSTLIAPCDGVITQVARTNHALTLTADNGAQLLIHIGIDTVKLGGKGFTPLVRQGQRVARGDALIEADFSVLAGKVPSLISVLVVANGDEYRLSDVASGTLVAGVTPFLSVDGPV